MDKDQSKLLSIQALRGIAAILVVFCHSEQFISPFLNVSMVNYLGQGFGGFGVDIFFVISGFIMVFICQNKFGDKKNSLPFLINRFMRIFPIYWIMTFIVLLIILPSGLLQYALPESETISSSNLNNINYLISSFLLLPYYTESGTQIALVIGVAWTLIYEMFFYYIFAVLLAFKRKYYLSLLTSIFLIIIGLQLGSRILHVNPVYPFVELLNTYGNNVILEFIFGCIIAELYLKKKLLPNRIAIIAILLATLSFIYVYHVPQAPFWTLQGWSRLTIVYHLKALGTGVPAALLVYGALSLEANKAIRIPQLFVRLGNASYSIYLTHFPIALVLFISILKQINWYIPLPGNLSVFVVWGLNVGLGYLVYSYIEKPITKILRTRRHPKNVSMAASK